MINSHTVSTVQNPSEMRDSRIPDFFDIYSMNDSLTEEKNEGPREKLERLPIEALTDKELIMLLIGAGSGRRRGEDIADDVLHLLDKKGQLSLYEAELISGLGMAKASALIAALELGRRKVTRKGNAITSPKDIFAEVRHYASRDQEHLIVVILNGAHEVIGTDVATIGLVNRTLVHPREVFAPAIEKRATAICVAHNHPSGNIVPSEEDKEVTKRLKSCSVILGIKLLDHVIFSQDSYYSFLEHSMI